MIDAALLRLGRLDKLLYCRLPNSDDRRDILTVAIRKLFATPEEEKIGWTTDIIKTIDAISQVTEGFSGADLQSIITNAQLLRVHEAIESISHSKLDINSISNASTHRQYSS